MVHYQGYAEVRVGKQRDAMDAVSALATTAGGGLEQQYGNTVVVRVPVAKFREVFDDALDGKKLALDVPEGFVALGEVSRFAARRGAVLAAIEEMSI